MPEIVPHQIIRSNRKTITLQINSKADLIIRAPNRISTNYIEDLLKKKHRWIITKQAEIKQKQVQPKSFNANEEFLYLGKAYPLKFSSEQDLDLVFDDGFYIKQNSNRLSKLILTKWYKKTALTIITEQVEFFAKIMDLQYKNISLSNAKTLWGSCTADNRLRFSWRLIMAPIDVINYVVVHELSHIKHKNHSAKFWANVASILPNYKTQRLWLKKHGHLLTLK